MEQRWNRLYSVKVRERPIPRPEVEQRKTPAVVLFHFSGVLFHLLLRYLQR